MEKAVVFILTLIVIKLVIAFLKNSPRKVLEDYTMNKIKELTLIPFDEFNGLKIYKIAGPEDMIFLGHIFENCMRNYDRSYLRATGQAGIALNYNYDHIFVAKYNDYFKAVLEINPESKIILQEKSKNNNPVNLETKKNLELFYEKYGFKKPSLQQQIAIGMDFGINPLVLRNDDHLTDAMNYTYQRAINRTIITFDPNPRQESITVIASRNDENGRTHIYQIEVDRFISQEEKQAVVSECIYQLESSMGIIPRRPNE